MTRNRSGLHQQGGTVLAVQGVAAALLSMAALVATPTIVRATTAPGDPQPSGQEERKPSKKSPAERKAKKDAGAPAGKQAQAAEEAPAVKKASPAPLRFTDDDLS